MVPSEMLRDPKAKVTPQPEPEPEQKRFPLTVPMPKNDLRELAREVAALHGITVGELIGTNRSPVYTPARSDFVMACRKSGKSFQKIAKFMSERHWATVIHYAKQHPEWVREAA